MDERYLGVIAPMFIAQDAVKRVLELMDIEHLEDVTLKEGLVMAWKGAEVVKCRAELLRRGKGGE